MEHEVLPCLDFGGHVRELELNALEVGNWTSKLLPLARVLESLFECSFGDSKREGGDPDASSVQRLHKVDEPHAFFAEQVFLGNFDLLEDELSGVGRPPSQLVFFLSSLESGHSWQRWLIADGGRSAVREISLLRHDE